MTSNRYFDPDDLDHHVSKASVQLRRPPQITGPIDPAILQHESKIYGSFSNTWIRGRDDTIEVETGGRDFISAEVVVKKDKKSKKVRKVREATRKYIELFRRNQSGQALATAPLIITKVERIAPELLQEQLPSTTIPKKSKTKRMRKADIRMNKGKLAKQEMITKWEQKELEKTLKKKLIEKKLDKVGAKVIQEIETTDGHLKTEVSTIVNPGEGMDLDHVAAEVDDSDSGETDIDIASALLPRPAEKSVLFTHLGTKSKSSRYFPKKGEWNTKKSDYLQTLVSAQPLDKNIDWDSITKFMNKRKYKVPVSVEVIEKYGKPMRNRATNSLRSSNKKSDKNIVCVKNPVVKSKSSRRIKREPIAIPKEVGIFQMIKGFFGFK